MHIDNTRGRGRRCIQSCDRGQDFQLSKNGLDCLSYAGDRAQSTTWPFDQSPRSALTPVTALDTVPTGVTPLAIRSL